MCILSRERENDDDDKNHIYNFFFFIVQLKQVELSWPVIDIPCVCVIDCAFNKRLLFNLFNRCLLTHYIDIDDSTCNNLMYANPTTEFLHWNCQQHKQQQQRRKGVKYLFRYFFELGSSMCSSGVIFCLFLVSSVFLAPNETRYNVVWGSVRHRIYISLCSILYYSTFFVLQINK